MVVFATLHNYKYMYRVHVYLHTIYMYCELPSKCPPLIFTLKIWIRNVSPPLIFHSKQDSVSRKCPLPPMFNACMHVPNVCRDVDHVTAMVHSRCRVQTLYSVIQNKQASCLTTVLKVHKAESKCTPLLWQQVLVLEEPHAHVQ